MWGWALVVMAVSGCRFGFSEVAPAADADVPVDAAPPVPGMARVSVIGEEGETRAGQPIADAYVVVIEATGATTTVRTLADGTVTVPILGASSIHIARPAPDLGAQHWLVYSFGGLNGDPEILVGGRATAPAGAKTMMVTLPGFPDVEITESRIRGPARCIDVEQAPTAGTTATFAFAAACANETVELYAQGLGYGDPWTWTPVGPVQLSPSGSATAPTTWQDNEKYSIDYAALPGSVATVWGLFALPGGAPGTAGWGDAIVLDDDWSAMDQGGARLVFDGPPLVAGSMFASFFEDASKAVERSVLERIDSPFGNRKFDPALIGPEVTVPLADASARGVAWASSDLAGADFVAVATTITTPGAIVTWNAYGPASTTAVTYPNLPAQLATIAVDTSASWSPPRLEIVSLSDFTYATALPILDRDLYWWHDVGAYLPTGTVAASTAQQPQTARPAPSRSAGAGLAGFRRGPRPPSGGPR